MKKIIICFIILLGGSSLISCNSEKNLNVNENKDQNVKVVNDQKNDSVSNGAEISLEKAKEIALNHANLKSNEIEFIRANKEFDDGKSKYEIEFYSGNKEFDYDIDITNGNILSYDYDVENYEIPNNKINSNGAEISLEKAKEIALNHANLKNNDVNFKKVSKETDDGRLKYEIEFYSGNKEFEYEIDANTGNVLSYDIEN